VRAAVLATILLGSAWVLVAQAGPFEGQKTASVGELLLELDRLIPELASSPALQADFEAFAQERRLVPSASLLRDYTAVKIAFEATRDGGLWGLAWTITDQKPNSDRIWAQWAEWQGDKPREGPTAYAECDELSALFAFVARRLAVSHVGLLWPSWNHTVAVWVVQDASGHLERVVIPTTQIFLTPEDRFGTRSFDPWAQKTIYDYGRRDVADSVELPAALATYFVQQVREFAGRSEAELQRRRNQISGSIESH